MIDRGASKLGREDFFAGPGASSIPIRIVWSGSNWPHPGRGKTREDLAPPYPSDDGAQINQLPKWTFDSTIQKKILVDNPAALYGFSAA